MWWYRHPSLAVTAGSSWFSRFPLLTPLFIDLTHRLRSFGLASLPNYSWSRPLHFACSQPRIQLVQRLSFVLGSPLRTRHRNEEPLACLRGRIRDDDHEILGTDLFEAVRAAGAREDRRARRDVVALAVERQLSFAAQHVIDLVLGLRVQSDPRAGMQRALAEDQRQPRRLCEERVPDRLPAAVVRARFLFGDVGVALDHRS